MAAVTTGDADAAIVYVTDAKAAGDAVEAVAIPDDAERDRDVPDRDLDGEHEQGDVERVHRLRDVVGGPSDAELVRVPAGSMRKRGARVPWLAVLLALVGFAFIALPLIGLVREVAWTDLWTDLRKPAATAALRLSIVCSLWAAALSVVFGVPLAWVLARVEFPGRALARALVLLPMVVPPVVGGVGLFYAFGRDGLVGQYLYDWFGIQLTFSTAGAVMAETFVAMPFLVITVEAALRSMDRRYEDAAATLGAGRVTVFRRVTLPLIMPGLIAGAALAWARALGEFGATITFAGNIQGRTQTMPLAVYLLLESDPPVSRSASASCCSRCASRCSRCLRDRWLGVG